MKSCLIVSVLFILSCNKVSLKTEQEDLSKQVSTKTILNSEDAEGLVMFPGLVKQTTTTYGITQCDSTYFGGSHSVRFELRDTDSMNNNGTRAEALFPQLTSLDRWYGFALKFDGDDYDYDTYDEVVMQWHQAGGSSPAMCFRTKQGKLWLRVISRSSWIDLGSLDNGNWHSYVMHVKHASDSTGLIELWKDGNSTTKIVNYSGANMYELSATVKMPTMKLGIYKANWNDSLTTMTNKRVLFYDNVKLGDATSSYSDVAP
jgi:hypothetical protein